MAQRARAAYATARHQAGGARRAMAEAGRAASVVTIQMRARPQRAESGASHALAEAEQGGQEELEGGYGHYRGTATKGMAMMPEAIAPGAGAVQK